MAVNIFFIGATGDGKSAVATPDGKKQKEEEEESTGWHGMIYAMIHLCYYLCPIY